MYSSLHMWGCDCLEEAGIPEAELDARLLLEHVCGTDRNTLYAHPDLEVTDEQQERYSELIGKRSARVPLQYLTGTQEFMGLSFTVGEDVLIPRQDTETLVEEALIEVEDGDKVLDLCTGSGCVLLSIMCYKNEIEGVGTDLSDQALAIAEQNAKNLEKKAFFLESDLFGQLPEMRFDVIVSNPPYIPSDVIETLQPEVKDHEPVMALDGGEDGLAFYRRIASDAPRYLKKGGKILLEIGYDQGKAVSGILKDAGFSGVTVKKDLAGNDRVVVACV